MSVRSKRKQMTVHYGALNAHWLHKQKREVYVLCAASLSKKCVNWHGVGLTGPCMLQIHLIDDDNEFRIPPLRLILGWLSESLCGTRGTLLIHSFGFVHQSRMKAACI